MKSKVLAASVLATVLSASAFAADLPSIKAPLVVPPPPPLWTGFYVGANAGGILGGNPGLTSSGVDIYDDYYPAAAGAAGALSADASGIGNGNRGSFSGGAQVGFNYQFNPSFLVGVEADIQGVAGSSVNTAFTSAAPDPLGSPTTMLTSAQFQGSLDYVGTVRARAGYLVTPTLLVYGTGGLAYANANMSASYATIDLAGIYGPGFASSSYSDTRVGWTAGGGVEWMFLPNWSAKLEYLYYDLGTVTLNSVVTWGSLGYYGYGYSTSASARFNGNLVRAGVNYHFTWGAPVPVLAKY
ncbi:MAG: outer membrane beta-barrel protein [Methylocystis sp.]